MNAITYSDLTISWASRIAATWQEHIDAIFRTGRILMDAKQALPHGEFTAMIERQLPFEARTAQMLMKISADPRLSNPQHVSLLPPHWGTLYELTKLDDDTFDARIEDGTINPDMERKAISTLVKQARRETRERDLGAKQQSLPQKKYGVILADPEWRFEPYSRETGMDRAPENHYPTSTTEVIASRDVASIAADDSLLMLWATGAMLRHGLRVMEAWGFEYRTHLCWIKRTKTWAFAIGTGYWCRNVHELVLIGTRGKIPAPAPGTQMLSAFDAPVGEHSEKPICVLDWIDQQYPSLPKIELNRRGPARPGWDAWGNESLPPHDPLTGEILEQDDATRQETREASPSGRPALSSTIAGAGRPPPEIDSYGIPGFLRRPAV